jgi:hypothetical protein
MQIVKSIGAYTKYLLLACFFSVRPYVAKAKPPTSAAPASFIGSPTATLGCTSWILGLL